MLVAVTGASGHLGAAVVRALLERGAGVRAVDLVSGPGLEGLDVDFVEADVRDRDSLRPAFRDASSVVHLAAKISIVGDPDGSVWNINVEGAGNVAIEAHAAGVTRLVHCSSVHGFDLEQVDDTLDETAVRAEREHLPIYDRSKWQGELRVRAVLDEGLDAIVVNPTGIIGPFDFQPSRMGRVLLAVRSGRLRFVVPGGFDWVDVRDVAGGIVAALEHGKTGENYLLGGTHHEVRALAELALDVSGENRSLLTIPRVLARAWSPLGTVVGRTTGSPWALTAESLHALENDPPVSSQKASVDLGYRPRPTADTIADFYSWFDSKRM